MKDPNAFKLLTITHLALLLGMFIFAIVAMVENGKLAIFTGESHQRIIQVICVALSLLSVYIGFGLFKRKMMAARNSTEPAEKRMEQYRKACIIWWSMIEWPGIIATIGFMLTNNYAFLALAVLHILILFIFMPRKRNVIVLLNLNSEEVQRLEGKQ